MIVSDIVVLNERGNYMLFTQGMSVLRVPFYQAGSDNGRRILYKKGSSKRFLERIGSRQLLLIHMCLNYMLSSPGALGLY